MVGWLTRVNLFLVLIITSGFPTACSTGSGGTTPTSVVSADIGSCSLGLSPIAGDEDTIAAMLRAEGDYVTQQDILALMRLWAEDGRVVDAKHTPNILEDDQTWQGTDAIRHRYVRWVFPGAPAMAQPADLVINLVGEEAVVTSTTQIGDEVSPAGDRWSLVKSEGCWVIQELVFNLESR